MADETLQVALTELAAQHYQEAIRLDPTYAQPHANLAILYQQVGRWHEADRHRNQALDLNSKYGTSGRTRDIVLPPRAAGCTATQQAAVENALGASRRAASLQATQRLGMIAGSGDAVVKITGSGGANVVAVEHVRLTTDQVLILDGKSSDVFIINVGGDFQLDDNSRIQLAGELAANQVLWNFFSRPDTRGGHVSRVIRGGPGSILYGTLLAPHDDVQWQGSIHGGLIAGGTTTGPPRVRFIPFVAARQAPPSGSEIPAAYTEFIDAVDQVMDEIVFAAGDLVGCATGNLPGC